MRFSMGLSRRSRHADVWRRKAARLRATAGSVVCPSRPRSAKGVTAGRLRGGTPLQERSRALAFSSRRLRSRAPRPAATARAARSGPSWIPWTEA